jgi:homoserine O-acetyltransferase/O-succinyltransferase
MASTLASYALAALFLGLCVGAGATEPGPVRIEKMNFTLHDFRLEGGGLLSEAVVAYATYGTLALDARNAVLVAHGFTSRRYAGTRDTLEDGQSGWWDGLIRPGKAIDTDRLFVVSCDRLGSSYGSTNPASIDPRTGMDPLRRRPHHHAASIAGTPGGEASGGGGSLLWRLPDPYGHAAGGVDAQKWALTLKATMDKLVATKS